LMAASVREREAWNCQRESISAKASGGKGRAMPASELFNGEASGASKGRLSSPAARTLASPGSSRLHARLKARGPLAACLPARGPRGARGNSPHPQKRNSIDPAGSRPKLPELKERAAARIHSGSEPLPPPGEKQTYPTRRRQRKGERAVLSPGEARAESGLKRNSLTQPKKIGSVWLASSRRRGKRETAPR
jgi:hypothetical protein